jgi:urease accessory protein
MAADTRKMRGDRPFVMTDLKAGTGLAEVVRFIEEHGLLG